MSLVNHQYKGRISLPSEEETVFQAVEGNEKPFLLGGGF
jgi:hypothetical protein